MAKPAGRATGRWRIVEMHQWDQDDIDLIEPGFIEFARNGTGDFGFVAVRGGMDCRWSERGWAILSEDDTLTGHLFIYMGEDSGFRATPLPRTEARGGR